MKMRALYTNDIQIPDTLHTCIQLDISSTLDGSNCDDVGGGAREELSSSIKAIECACGHV